MKHENWNGFKNGVWQDEINVRDFIQQNYKEYKGDSSFLSGATKRTKAVMKKVELLFALERQQGGVLDIDTATVSSLTSYSPGYIDKANELIVGMQTNRPLRRGVNPFGGIRMARQACEAAVRAECKKAGIVDEVKIEQRINERVEVEIAKKEMRAHYHKK